MGMTIANIDFVHMADPPQRNRSQLYILLDGSSFGAVVNQIKSPIKWGFPHPLNITPAKALAVPLKSDFSRSPALLRLVLTARTHVKPDSD